MSFVRKHTRFVSLFVVAFLCLNAGGALCLTYCSQKASANSARADESLLSDHCRKAKKQAEKRSDNSSVTPDEAACCMLPVGMFPAPVEKSLSYSVVLAGTVEIPNFDYSAPVILDVSSKHIPVYRPPPLDRRVERLLNCVIRI